MIADRWLGQRYSVIVGASSWPAANSPDDAGVLFVGSHS